VGTAAGAHAMTNSKASASGRKGDFETFGLRRIGAMRGRRWNGLVWKDTVGSLDEILVWWPGNKKPLAIRQEEGAQPDCAVKRFSSCSCPLSREGHKDWNR
jgi:hypothetical protein